MPNLKDIKRRIGSVEKTQQITSAMRMVAAAKLRRAQDAIIAARPYSDRMYQTLREIGRRHSDGAHPLLEDREDKGTLEVVVVTSDRGLCGAFNAAAIKHAEAFVEEHRGEYSKVLVSGVGRKADEYLRRHYRAAHVKSWTGIATVAVRHAEAIAEHLTGRFLGQVATQLLADIAPALRIGCFHVDQHDRGIRYQPGLRSFQRCP